MNIKPIPRNVQSVDKDKYHASYSEATEEAAEAVKEEDEAIGGGTEDILKESDESKPIIAMAIPDWFCTIVCAGLDLE